MIERTLPYEVLDREHEECMKIQSLSCQAVSVVANRCR
jgi:hypothetical protein